MWAGSSATNGTDTISGEVAALGIAEPFDAIFNTADIGFAKPDIRAFEHVLDALSVTAPEVFFTDDSASKLVGADSLSMHVHLFQGIGELCHELRAAGVDVQRSAASAKSSSRARSGAGSA